MPNTTVRRILTVEGVQYYYDEMRDKTLSIPKVYLRAGIYRRTVTDEFLHLEDGQPAMSVGDGLFRDATLTAISANCEIAHTWTVKIFKKGVPSPLVTFPLAGLAFKDNTTLNVDVDRGSVLLFKVEGTNIPFPRILLELAWRITV